MLGTAAAETVQGEAPVLAVLVAEPGAGEDDSEMGPEGVVRHGLVGADTVAAAAAVLPDLKPTHSKPMNV